MKVLAILIGKLVILAGRILKRGTSLPGKIALKFDKKLLKKFKLPKTVIAVTGSAGKGSTSSILAHVYKSMGYKVVHNFSGANLKPGITTMLLENCNLMGKVKGDILIYEIDERYAKYVFPDVKPGHVIVTNITRDQPPRQGHFDLVFEDIKKALPEGVHLVLNGDDPYLLKFNLNNEYKTTYYTLDETNLSYKKNKFKNLNIQYCPKCNSKLEYDYYHFETLGMFKCPNCDFEHPDSEYHITNIDYGNYQMTINDKHIINLQYDMLYSVYNTMAAFVTASIMGLNEEKTIKSINEINSSNKIYNHYLYNDKEVYILNNKNENSTTFNQSLLFVERFEGTKTIIVGWKEISRRYEFNDLSWLYDIDFEILKNCDIDKILCGGPNAKDIAVRMKLAGFDDDKIEIFENPDSVRKHINECKSKYIFNILNFDYVEPFKKIFQEEVSV